MSEKIFMEQLNKYYAVWRETNYVYNEWAKEHNLSTNSLFILLSIYEDEQSCTQKKISRKWLISKQTINMALKEFERHGFVELLPLPEDKRNKIIRFTSAGKQYAENIIAELRQAELAAIAVLGTERMRQLNDNMALFIELFAQAGGKIRHESKV